MAEEQLYMVEGATATPADRVRLTEAGLLERQHLPEWVIVGGGRAGAPGGCAMGVRRAQGATVLADGAAGAGGRRVPARRRRRGPGADSLQAPDGVTMTRSSQPSAN